MNQCSKQWVECSNKPHSNAVNNTDVVSNSLPPNSLKFKNMCIITSPSKTTRTLSSLIYMPRGHIYSRIPPFDTASPGILSSRTHKTFHLSFSATLPPPFSSDAPYYIHPALSKSHRHPSWWLSHPQQADANVSTILILEVDVPRLHTPHILLVIQSHFLHVVSWLKSNLILLISTIHILTSSNN